MVRGFHARPAPIYAIPLSRDTGAKTSYKIHSTVILLLPHSEKSHASQLPLHTLSCL